VSRLDGVDYAAQSERRIVGKPPRSVPCGARFHCDGAVRMPASGGAVPREW
jgi:hypothetical protein